MKRAAAAGGEGGGPPRSSSDGVVEAAAREAEPERGGAPVAAVDVGVDRMMQELKQHQQYGGMPVGHIIVRPGEDWATVLWGCLLLGCTFLFFVGSLYAIVVAKHMPTTGNVFIDAIKDDHYYCYLVPFTIPVLIIAVISNWVALKFFRHN